MKIDIDHANVSRRGLLKGLAAFPFAYGLSKVNAAANELFIDRGYISEEAKVALQDLKGLLPKGKLGKFEISRLIIGCNPMGGWSHSRDLSYVGTLSKKWHTPVKMKQTWAMGENAGINLANLTEDMYAIFNEYKKETGSKLMNMYQCSIGQPNDRLAPLKKAVQDGADFIYIQGENTDSLAATNNLDVLLQALEYTHSQGILFGVGAHSIQTIITSIQLGVKPDFYYKTFHHDNYWSATPKERREEYPTYQSSGASAAAPQVFAGSPGAQRVSHDSYNDNMWDQFSDRTIEVFNNIKVPFFGFKVMAAGAITPADGIRWAFENGADFVCAGMYDFQIVADVNTTIDILESLGTRVRPWYA
jgi:hypothetical protein